MLRAACLVATALAALACSQSDVATSVNGPPITDGARSATTGYTRVDLGTLGGRSSYAAAINSSGVVVGWSETRAGETHAFRWTPTSGMVDLGTLPGEQSSQAVAILDAPLNGGAQILGLSGSAAAVWSASASISVLPVPLIPSATLVYPQGFNDRGEVVGFDAGGNLSQRAWIWSARDGKLDLTNAIEAVGSEGSASAITASGIALLTTRAATCRINAQCSRTYLWSRTSGFEPLGVPSDNSEVSVTGLAINDARTVVGWTGALAGVAPYRWTEAAGFTVLPNYSSATYAYAAAVNASGNTVGGALEPVSGSIVATLWPANGGIQRLSPDDPNPSVALAINRDGTIAGWASVNSDVNHAVVWVPTSQAARQQTASLKQSPNVVSRASAQTESLSAKNGACLSQMQSLRSRQALFACVMNADVARRIRSE